jgi:hypothetical protein
MDDKNIKREYKIKQIHVLKLNAFYNKIIKQKDNDKKKIH